MQKIGIYGGTFDPVHTAHLILAGAALEKFALEKIIFVPARTSPHKGHAVAPADVRLRMLRRAIEGEAQFEIDDCELHRPPPSYTIDTIEKVREKYSGTQLFLLMGDDNLAALPMWRRFADLQRMVKFIVLQRTPTPLLHDYLRVERRIDISATEIRKRVANNRSIRYFVPQAVEQIIRAQGLYREVTK